MFNLFSESIHRRDRDGIRQIDFRDTEHYQVTRRFLNAQEDMLGTILVEGG